MSVEQKFARSLGVFSLALGAVQLVAPRRFAKAIGVTPSRERPGVVRLVGAREAAAAAGLLMRRRPVVPVWMRVAGDAMDIALLGRALRSRQVRSSRVAAAIGAVATITVVDVVASTWLTRRTLTASKNGSSASKNGASASEIPVRHAITIGADPGELYDFWRTLENLPRFMRHLESVTAIDDRRSSWRAKGPGGSSVEWEAEIVDERPGELLSWRSVEGSQVQNEGTVRFVPAPGGRGTELHVELTYEPPAGPFGATVAKLFGEEPSQQTSDDLRRLKQIIETGDVLSSEATVGGRRVRQHPAQPSLATAQAH
ncbi:MAG: SRPBCC family protein [Chloroflexota bacterium]